MPDSGAQGVPRTQDFISTETRNAVLSFAQLVMTTAVTMIIAVMVRIYIPRKLGAESFGSLYFAETAAATVLIFASLGIDTLARRETATRPTYANDFLGAIFALRAVIGAVLIPLLCLTFGIVGRSWKELLAIALFGIGHIFACQTNTITAILQAKHKLSFLTTVNILAKATWGIALFSALKGGSEYAIVAAVFLFSEAARFIALTFYLQAKSDLRLGMNLSAARQALVLSTPFFAHQVIYKLYERIDGQIIALFANRMETGWYGAVSNIIAAAMLLIPVANGAIVPFMARLAHGAPDRLRVFTDTLIRFTLFIGGTVSITCWINAEHIVTLLFGPDYTLSAATLKILSVLIPLTYLASFSTSRLIQDNQSWSVTKISLIALGLNPLLSVIGVRFFLLHWGAGGAGIGASIATIACELLTVVLLLRRLHHEGASSGMRRELFWSTSLFAAALLVTTPMSTPSFAKTIAATALFSIGMVSLGVIPWRIAKSVVTTFFSTLRSK